MNFENILETAEWLGKNNDVVKIIKLKELFDNKKFYVTVWGHYSAGKSKLINNLLNKDILPVQTRETTAVMTYIQYGEVEECRLVYEDGTSSVQDLSVLKDVFQNTDKFEGISKISYIEVYINNDILESGLVLVDTPGVNTIIQKHQDLAVEAIEQSGRIVYVLGNSPSNVDKQFIEQIVSCGIRISFVRTKCDRFSETEEDINQSLKKEEADLMSFAGINTEFIPVSNENGSEWFGNIEKVREVLKVISAKISEEINERNSNQLSTFKTQYISELKKEESDIQDLINGNSQKLTDEMEKCKADISMLDDKYTDIEKRIEKRVEETKVDSQREVEDLIDKRIEEFEKALTKIEVDDDGADKVAGTYKYHISRTVEKIKGIFEDKFYDIMKDELATITEDLSDTTIELPVPSYLEVQHDNSAVLDMYRSRLLEAKNKIAKILEEKKETEEGIKEKEFDEDGHKETLALLDKELKEIPTGIALRQAENKGIQPSEVFKRIGVAADLALLALPGEAVFNGIKTVAKTAKITESLNKMGKAGKIIIDAANAAGKSVNTIDKIRDWVYSAGKFLGIKKCKDKIASQEMEKVADYAAKRGMEAFEAYKESRNSGNIFDIFSVAYWTEKLGKQFDSEPKMEIDKEEQYLRDKKRKEITEEQQIILKETMRRKKEIGVLKDKAKELQELEKEEAIKEKNIVEEMERVEKKLRKEALQKALNKYKKDYIAYYTEAIEKISQDIRKQYFNVANQNIVLFISSKTTGLVRDIEEKKEQINKLLEMGKKANGDMEVRLMKCRELLDKLERVE